MKKEIFQKIETTPTPDFGSLLSRSFDLFKKIWLESFIHVLITMIAVLPFVFIVYMPFVPAIISSVRGGSSRNIEPYMDYPILMIVGYFVLLFILLHFIVDRHYFIYYFLIFLKSNFYVK